MADLVASNRCVLGQLRSHYVHWMELLLCKLCSNVRCLAAEARSSAESQSICGGYHRSQLVSGNRCRARSAVRRATIRARSRCADAGLRCPDAGFAPVYCHRTVSHLLGITRAMRLKRIEESSRGFRYDAVLLSRWDVLWQQPLLDLSGLKAGTRTIRSDGGGRFGCRASAHRWSRGRAQERGCALERASGRRLPRILCGGGASPWLASQSARECSRAARARARRI